MSTTAPALGTATLRTIAELPFAAAETYGDKPALRFRHDGDDGPDGGWREQSFTELADTVRAVALGLIEAGIGAGDRVCVLADTRREWTYAGLGVIAAGAVLVPIYPSSSVEECAWVAGNSGARMVICDNAAQLAKIDAVRDRLPDLATTVLIDGATGVQRSLDGLMVAGRAASAASVSELDRRRAALDPDGACLIIYTSGTTGPAKGCVLTHRNWLALCAIIEELGHVTADDVVYLFLPLAHVFAQIVQYGCMYAGGTLVYYGGDPRRVIPELAEVRPTFLPSVPRVFEKLYTLVAGSVDPQVLAGAVRVGLEARRLERAGEPVPAEIAAAVAAAEPLFGKVRALFGGRLKQALSGAAPISVQVLEFFSAAGVPVLEGYGMTESCGLGTVTTLDRFRLGTVGVAAPGAQARIADDGEILMAGPHIFAGYWRDPDATSRSIVDGWLHTGDLGELDADGFLRITGRKKDIIITAGGKNITPANIENQLRQSRWISHAVLYGDARPYPVALISLDVEEVVPWAKEQGLPSDLAELAGHPQVRELIRAVVDEANASHSQAAQVKRFAILDRDLTQDDGELTPTLKVKRAVVHTNHAEAIESLYA